MKILLIGLGRWGQNHLRTLKELGVDVVTCDIDESKLPDGNDYRDLINGVDAVDIVTSTDSHFKICIDCIGRKKDIFVEKPITMDTHEAILISKYMNGTGIIFQVGHIYRYHPVSVKVKDLLENGLLGDIRYAYGHFIGFKRPRTDVGVTQTDAIHYYDLFNYLFGRLPNSVTAFIKNYLDIDFDDTSISILDYGGKMVWIEVGYMATQERKDVAIIGSRGSIYCDFRQSTMTVSNSYHDFIDGKWVAMEGNEKTTFVCGEALKIELDSFIKSVETRSIPISNCQTGYEALAIVRACHESSKRGEKVNIVW